jgi:glutathione S-transferase
MLEELGLNYEVMPLDLSVKEQKSESYLKLNPNGKVPTLIDGDFVIWESMAINTYLAEREKSPLVGLTAKEKGAIQQWSYWATLELQKPIIDWFIQEVFVPVVNKDLHIIEKCKEAISHNLPILEKSLTNSGYLVGDRFTMADLNTCSVVNICYALKFDLSPYRQITKWLGACSDRPAFQKLKKMREQK